MDTQPPAQASSPASNPFALQLDLRDVMGVGGAVLTLGAAATWSWAAAAAVAGVGLVAAAIRLSGRR